MTRPTQALPLSPTEVEDAKQVDAALRLLMSKDLAGAERILTDVISRAPGDPRDYVHRYEQDGTLHIKFWSMEEFAYYVTLHQENIKQQLAWIPSAYPRAFFYLGFVREAQGDHEGAIRWLDEGLKLEPAHPMFRIEKARAYSGLKQYQRALALYAEVEQMGEAIPANLRAVALRGKGFQLIELGDLDLAERYFLDSLKLEPSSSVARHELEYIQHLRGGGRKSASESVTYGGQKGLHCSRCGGDVGNGRMFNHEGRVIWLCPRCVEQVLGADAPEPSASTDSEEPSQPKKKWWRFWN